MTPKVRITASARKHRISQSRIIVALENAELVATDGDADPLPQQSGGGVMATFKERHGKPEVDTSDEPFVYHGEELTDERAERLARESLDAVRRRNLVPGRKSLTGDGKHSPVVQFRVSEPVRDALEAQAEREGLTRSKLARKALDEYLERHAG